MESVDDKKQQQNEVKNNNVNLDTIIDKFENFDVRNLKIRITRHAFEKHKMHVYWIENDFAVFGWGRNMFVHDDTGMEVQIDALVDEMHTSSLSSNMCVAAIHSIVPCSLPLRNHIIYFEAVTSELQSESDIVIRELTKLEKTPLKTELAFPNDIATIAKTEFGVVLDFNLNELSQTPRYVCLKYYSTLYDAVKTMFLKPGVFTKATCRLRYFKQIDSQVLYYILDEREVEEARKQREPIVLHCDANKKQKC